MIERFVGGPLGGNEWRREWRDARTVEALWDMRLPLDAPPPAAIDLTALRVRYLPHWWSDGSLTYVFDHRNSAPNPNPVACVEAE